MGALWWIKIDLFISLKLKRGAKRSPFQWTLHDYFFGPQIGYKIIVKIDNSSASIMGSLGISENVGGVVVAPVCDTKDAAKEEISPPDALSSANR